jgi:hypothetical protein
MRANHDNPKISLPICRCKAQCKGQLSCRKQIAFVDASICHPDGQVRQFFHTLDTVTL